MVERRLKRERPILVTIEPHIRINVRTDIRANGGEDKGFVRRHLAHHPVTGRPDGNVAANGDAIMRDPLIVGFARCLKTSQKQGKSKKRVRRE